MKKYFLSIVAGAFAISASAQSLEEGIKAFKYECYSKAQQILTPLAASNALANYYLGESYLEMGKVNEAKAIFAKYPEDAANMGGAARAAFESGNAAGGMQMAQALAARSKKKDWEPLKYAADAITYADAGGGNYQYAVDWYKKALSINDNADLHIGLGDAYLHVPGGGGEAMNNYENVTGKDPKNSLAFSRIGALWYAAKNYNLALESYEKAKQADPTNPLPYRDLARAYSRSGNDEKALENIEQYRKLSCEADEVEYMDILFRAKHYKEAIQKANELINKGIVKPRFYGVLGFSEYEVADSINALKHIRMFISQMDPKKLFPGDYIYFGKAFLMNHMNDSADAIFKKAVEMDTSRNKSDTYRMIAEAFKANKDWAKSASWYNKLVTEYPESQPLDYFWSVVMYYYAKDYANGDVAAEKYETKYPNESSAIYWHGRVKAAVDSEAKTGAAVPYFTKWLDKIGPNSDRKNDMKIADEYLLLYYYNREDKEMEKKYIEQLNLIDPNDALKKQIEELMKSPKLQPKKK